MSSTERHDTPRRSGTCIVAEFRQLVPVVRCGECSKAVRDGGRLTCDAWAQWDGNEWQRPETEAEGFCWKGETDGD